VVHESQSVDHVAGFQRIDSDVLRFGEVILRHLGRSQAIAEKGELSPKVEDEFVDLGEVVTVMETTLELIAEQGTQALPAANSFEHRERGANALRSQIHRHCLAVFGARSGVLSR
jgi:hypothetical protein